MVKFKSLGKDLSGLMLDSISIGIDITDYTGIKSSVYNKMKRQLRSNTTFDIIQTTRLILFTIGDKHSKVKLALNSKEGGYFLNISGSPINYLSKQNQVGSVELPTLLYDFIIKLKEDLKKYKVDMPEAVLTALSTGEIYIHRISFSVYAQPMVKGVLSKLVNAIGHIYNFADLDSNKSVASTLQLKVEASTNDKSVKLERMSGNNRYWYLTISNKMEEVAASGDTYIKKLNSRLLLGLTLMPSWFSKRKIKTLGDLYSKLGPDYVTSIYNLFDTVLRSTKLKYIMSFPTLEGLDIGEFGQELSKWENGEEISESAQEYFESIGLDTSLSFDWHLLVNTARLTLDMPRALQVALLKRDEEMGTRALKGWIKNGYNKNFLPLMREAEKLEYDKHFPKYRLKGRDLISLDDGEVTRIKYKQLL